MVRVVGKGCWFGGFVRVVGGDGQWGWQGVGRGLEVQLEVGLKGGGGGWGGGGLEGGNRFLAWLTWVVSL